MTTSKTPSKGQPTKTNSDSHSKGTTGNAQKASQSNFQTDRNSSSMGTPGMKKPINADRKSTSKWSDEDQDDESNI